MSAQIFQFSDYRDRGVRATPMPSISQGYAIAENSAFISAFWFGLGIIGIGTCIMLAASAVRSRAPRFS